MGKNNFNSFKILFLNKISDVDLSFMNLMIQGVSF